MHKENVELGTNKLILKGTAHTKNFSIMPVGVKSNVQRITEQSLKIQQGFSAEFNIY